jgi:hypothetical protein
MNLSGLSQTLRKLSESIREQDDSSVLLQMTRDEMQSLLELIRSEPAWETFGQEKAVELGDRIEVILNAPDPVAQAEPSGALGEQEQQAMSVEMAEDTLKNAKEHAGTLHKDAKDMTDRIATYVTENLNAVLFGLDKAAKEDPEIDPRTDELKELVESARKAEGTAADLSIILGSLHRYIPGYIA